MDVSFLCKKCEQELVTDLNSVSVKVECNECGEKRELKPSDSVIRENVVDVCTICDCNILHTQTDFNRKLGLLIVAIGAILSIYTYGISLIICALIDYLLYRYLPKVTVCYRCQCVYRRFTTNPEHEAYDIHTAELFAEQ